MLCLTYCAAAANIDPNNHRGGHVKKIVTAVCVCIALVSCTAKQQPGANEEQREQTRNKKAKIRYERIYDYTIKEGKTDKRSKFLVQESEFDRQGRLLRKSVFHRPGSGLDDYDYSLVHEYDDKGLRVKTLHRDKAGNTVEYSEYVYDERGNCVEYRTFGADGVLVSKERGTVDAQGARLVWESFGYPEGQELRYCETAYNAGGYKAVFFDRNGKAANSIVETKVSDTQTRRENINSKGQPVEITVLGYDKYGRVVSERQEYTAHNDFDQFRNTHSSRVYKYDRKGFVTESRSFDNDENATTLRKYSRKRF